MRANVRRYAWLFSVLGSFIAHVDQAHAEPIRVIKTITWVFSGDPSKELGFTDYEISALARDVHIDDPKRDGPFLDYWIIGDGLPAKNPTSTIAAGGAPHPSADASIDFSASRPRDLGNGLFEVIGTIDATVRAEVVPVLPGDHTDQVAGAVSTGTMELKSGVITGRAVSTSQGQLFLLEDAIESGSIPLNLGVTNLRAHAVVTDPVSIRLLEVETGTVTVERLFDFSSSRDLFGNVSWDNQRGIVLESPFDGVSSASLSGGTNSTWITSGPGIFSASLAGGTFTATGAFASLPWALTYDGANIVRAELDPSLVPSLGISYRVPAELLTSTSTYQQSLDFSLSASVEEEAAVPEPNSFSLILFGLGLTSVLMVARSSRQRQTIR